MDAIRIEGLRKSYDEVDALNGISLAIPEGSFFGLLGPNGAGKTTLIHCVAGLAEPTAGSVSVLGYDNRKEYRDARRLIGLSQQELHMDPFFSLIDLLTYQGQYFNVPRAEARDRAEKLLKRFGIWDKRDKTPREISGGQKRRVEIAKALVHGPKVLILDEPTAGLDVETRRDLWREIGSLNTEGLTVLLTTHYIEEAQELCDTVAIIHEGSIRHVEEKTALLDRFAKKTITAHYAKAPKAVRGMKREGSSLHAELTVKQDEGAAIAKMQAAGDIIRIETRRQSLEEVFLELTRRKGK